MTNKYVKHFLISLKINNMQNSPVRDRSKRKNKERLRS